MIKVPTSVRNQVPVICLTNSHFSATAVLTVSMYNLQGTLIRGGAVIFFTTNREFKFLCYEAASQTLPPGFNDLVAH